MLTDTNLFGADETPHYTLAGAMWSAIDLLLGAEEIRAEMSLDPYDAAIDEEFAVAFETRATELLAT